MTYAGIGSRSTPVDTLHYMTMIARKLDKEGYLLNSGGAFGSDTAFERGSTNANIYYAHDKKLPKPPGIIDIVPNMDKGSAIVKEVIGYFDKLQHYTKKLFSRNAYQVLGRDLNSKVDFVICYTTRGKYVGGTAIAMRISDKYSIPIYNLGDEYSYKILIAYLSSSLTFKEYMKIYYKPE